MLVYKIPVYSYFSGIATNKYMQIPIYCSDYLVQKYKEAPAGTETQLYYEEFEEGADINVIDKIKEHIGDNLLFRDTPVYINDPNNYRQTANQYAPPYVYDKVGIVPYYDTFSANEGDVIPNEVYSVNDKVDFPLTGSYGANFVVNGFNWFTPTCHVFSRASYVSTEIRDQGTTCSYVSSLLVYPESVMRIAPRELPDDDSDNPPLRFEIGVSFYKVFEGVEVVGVTVRNINIRVQKFSFGYRYFKAAFYNAENLDGPATDVTDTDNPYGNYGNSGIGGGNGHGGDIDSVEGTPIPDLPSISAAELGFITIYNPSRSQLFALSDFLWSGLFDLDTYKKLFSDPMQSIIGLAIVPVAPTIAGNKNVMFGTIDSGVSMPYLSTQYVQFNCGDVTIEDYIGSFLDFSPYTKISIYLPYIGIHELSPDDIMNDTINVTYNIDVLSGACGAFISSAKKGVLYSYNGSCISNIPLTSINFSSAIQNAVSAVCSGAAMIAGVVTEAAPLTAAGAIGLLGNGANAALNSKPTVQRSGSLGGSAGVLSVQKPYLIIERPNLSVPANVQKMVGQCSNITAYLGNLSGFTMVEYVHLQGIPATDEEIQEIEALLKEGVIL